MDDDMRELAQASYNLAATCSLTNRAALTAHANLLGLLQKLNGAPLAYRGAIYPDKPEYEVGG